MDYKQTLQKSGKVYSKLAYLPFLILEVLENS